MKGREEEDGERMEMQAMMERREEEDVEEDGERMEGLPVADRYQMLLVPPTKSASHINFNLFQTRGDEDEEVW